MMLITTVDFSSLPNTGAGAAGSNLAGTGLIDQTGGVFSVVSGTLRSADGSKHLLTPAGTTISNGFMEAYYNVAGGGMYSATLTALDYSADFSTTSSSAQAIIYDYGGTTKGLYAQLTGSTAACPNPLDLMQFPPPETGYCLRLDFYPLTATTVGCSVSFYSLDADGNKAALLWASSHTALSFSSGTNTPSRLGFDGTNVAVKKLVWGNATPVTVAPLTVASATKSSVTLSGGGASGGYGGPWATTLYRSRVYPTVPGNPGVAVMNAIGTDSGLTPSTDYYYVCYAVDTGNGADNGTWSNIAYARTYGRNAAASGADKIVLGVIGDSIYATAVDADGRNAPALVALGLAQFAGGTPDAIAVVNKAVSGSASNHWAIDAAPSNTDGAGNRVLYTAAVAAFNAGGVTDVLFRLGANDASAVIPATGALSFASYLGPMFARLFIDVPTLKRLWLNYNLWNNAYGENHSSAAAVLAMLAGYNEWMASQVNGTTIMMGDTTAYGRFKALGVGAFFTGASGDPHPNAKGISVLADLMLVPLVKYFYPREFVQAADLRAGVIVGGVTGTAQMNQNILLGGDL